MTDQLNLVTGATGFIGSNLARQLARDGQRVRVLVRRPEKLKTVGLKPDEVVKGDITDPDAVGRALEGVHRVYAIAGTFREPNLGDADYRRVNVEAVRIMMQQAAEQGATRVVHCSTCGVHGNVPRGESIDEDQPFRGVGIYEETKAAGDRLARELGEQLGVEAVVVRPTQVYGPGDTRLLKLFKMTDKDRPLMIGDGSGGYHLVHIDDLVQGLMLAGQHPDAAGQAFLIGGGQVPTVRELFLALGEIHGREGQRLRHIPAAPVMAAGVICETLCRPLNISPPIYRRRVEFFTNHRSFSIDKARRVLGYEPRVDMVDGLQRTAAWYRQQGLL